MSPLAFSISYAKYLKVYLGLSKVFGVLGVVCIFSSECKYVRFVAHYFEREKLVLLSVRLKGGALGAPRGRTLLMLFQVLPDLKELLLVGLKLFPECECTF